MSRRAELVVALGRRLGLAPARRAAAAEAGWNAPGLARFSNLASTAFKRHVQTLHEQGDLRNPDVLAGALLTPAERHAASALSTPELAALRREPYYHYLAARTTAYDQLLLQALVAGVRQVVLLGAGFDTRLHRFGGVLAAVGARLCETDQPGASQDKRARAAHLPHAARITYIAVDLNEAPSRSALLGWLRDDPAPALVLGEGVSPYVDATAWGCFLGELGGALPAGSWLAYDFKRDGAADQLGRSERVSRPQRFGSDDEAIAAVHLSAGFSAARVLRPAALMAAHLPSWSPALSPLFEEDALLVATR